VYRIDSDIKKHVFY